MLSAGPLSGLLPAKHSNSRNCTESTATTWRESHQHTSLVHSTHASVSNRTMQQQQRRLMSSGSNDNAETGVEASNAVDVEGDSVSSDAEADAAPVEEEEATTAPVSAPILLVQVDGIPFSLTQGELEQWLVDSGCNPVQVTMPLRPESSNRTGQNKGKAYIEMADEEGVQAALALGGRSIGERWVNVARLAMHMEEVRLRRAGGSRGRGSQESQQLGGGHVYPC